MKPLALGIVPALLFATFSAFAQQTLDIYWTDADGAAATLIVTPEGQSILVDSAFERPENTYANRIKAAMDDAGVTQIDYAFTTHYQGDHVGGLFALAEMVPIIEFVDHGETSLTDDNGQARYARYVELAATGKRTTVRPGMTLPVRGVDLIVVASHKEFLTEPLTGSAEPNPVCATANPSNLYCRGDECVSTALADFDGEDIYSAGFQLSMGNFEYVNVGDLSYGGLHALVCPVNLIGTIDLLEFPHHGNDVAPQFVSSLAPVAAVSNTGATKGGNPDGYEAAAASPGLEGFWQAHYATGTDDEHNTERRKIANLAPENEHGHWIKAEVQPDGSSFTITNARNGYSETYTSR